MTVFVDSGTNKVTHIKAAGRTKRVTRYGIVHFSRMDFETAFNHDITGYCAVWYTYDIDFDLSILASTYLWNGVLSLPLRLVNYTKHPRHFPHSNQTGSRKHAPSATDRVVQQRSRQRRDDVLHQRVVYEAAVCLRP